MGKVLEAPSVITDLLGTLLEGRYRVDDVLAVGGMSVVFRGHHLRIKRDVAIKVLDPSLGPGASTRFLREAESAAQLDHPNCITVHDFGVSSSGLSFMVMPLLAGETLRARPPGRWDPARAVRLIVEVLRGLDHAHGHGVIHRDLKPENIFICLEPDGSRVAKIVDFGLAKVIRGSEADSTTTMTGLMAGTPAYMSPEQALGLVVDERADLYSIGMMLYELLAGVLPFDSDDGVALLRMQLHEDLPPLPTDLPAPLIGIVTHLTAKERDHRPASARAVLDDLEAFLRGDGHTILAPPIAVRRATPEMASMYPAAVPDGATPTSSISAPMMPLTVEATLLDHDDDPPQPRAGRWWLWVAAGVATASAATVVALTWSTPFTPPAAEPSIAAVEPATGVASGERARASEEAAGISGPTKLLALVNDPDFGSREGYVRRHELLSALARSNAHDKVDLRLQVGLDLLQAQQSPTPCRTFGESLDTIAKAGAADYADVLRRARVPDSAVDPGACEGLAARLEGLRGDGAPAVDPPAPELEVEDDDDTVVAAVKKPKPNARSKARPAPRSKRSNKPPASRALSEPGPPVAEPPTRPDPPAKSARKSSITKLDDDLRPPE